MASVLHRHISSLYVKGSLLSTLDYVNNVLSSISPLAMYMNNFAICANNEAKRLYVNMFLDVFSSIQQFAMYMNNFAICASNEAKQSYVNMFLDSDDQMIQRAKTARIFDLCITIDRTDMVPLAIQIELFFYNGYNAISVLLSPFTHAYYLQFLCYHDMHLSSITTETVHYISLSML